MLRWDRVFSEYFGFRLSASFHQFSAFIFTYKLLLPQVERGEVWELSKEAMPLRKSGNTGKKNTLIFSSLKAYGLLVSSSQISGCED
jgi:hypothetical protein